MNMGLIISIHIATVLSMVPITLPEITTINTQERLLLPADRTYYIGCVEEAWNYTPKGINILDGLPVDQSEQSSTFTKNGVNRIGKTYIKALYHEFTDSSFTQRKPIEQRWKQLGLLGPVIRGTVGQRLKIVFKNLCRYPYSMHAHGVLYKKQSEGAVYLDEDNRIDGPGDKVEPGDIWVYFWDVRREAGGSIHELSSKWWLYHSHVNEAVDENSGLMGPIIINMPGAGDDIPRKVDKEFLTLFKVIDENASQYLKLNVYTFVPNFASKVINGTIPEIDPEYDALIEDDDFKESNLMHAMNGLMYGDIGKYYNNILLGERVRWYIAALGTEVDLHSSHWHGNLVFFDDKFEDVTQLLPAITQTMDMIPDAPGTWLYHCHVNDHIDAGMVATYTVLNQTRKHIRHIPKNPLIARLDKVDHEIKELDKRVYIEKQQQIDDALNGNIGGISMVMNAIKDGTLNAVVGREIMQVALSGRDITRKLIDSILVGLKLYEIRSIDKITLNDLIHDNIENILDTSQQQILNKNNINIPNIDLTGVNIP